MTPETGNRVSIDTARAVLVPAELYVAGAEEALLRFNGMWPAGGERGKGGEVAVASEPRDGIVAVVAVPNETWNGIQGETGEPLKDKYEKGEATVTSPLLDVATGGHGKPGGRRGRRKHEANILLTAENVYIAVWEDGVLQMAEAFPDDSVDSLLYYMQVVGRNCRLSKFDINVGGPRAGAVADALRHYYKKVRVADR